MASLDAFKEAVLKKALQPYGMPRFSDTLTPADIGALQAYLIDQWWQAYDAERANQEKPAH
jgi:mono/diheme cytochrome c family protein